MKNFHLPDFDQALTEKKKRPFQLPHDQSLFNNRGFSLVEILVSIAIFSLIIAGIYSAYISQLGHSRREYKLAEHEMEFGIAKNIIVRDIDSAGYGLANDYGTTGFNPRPAAATNSDTAPDTLTLMGTALGVKSRATRGWTYITDASGPNFRFWGDALEDPRTDASGNNDLVIIMEPSTKTLLTEGNAWRFQYNGLSSNLTTYQNQGSTPNGTALSSPATGTLVYGIGKIGETEPTQPYYAVRYYLGGTSPSTCQANTLSLMRAESATTENPTAGDRLLACVLDFQVAFGLDTNDDGTIDIWDNGGATQAAGMDAQTLKKRLKQIKAYILVQSGNRDATYTFPQATVRVGDSSLNTGRNFYLTTDQRRYRWKLVSLTVTPRNIR